MHALARGSVAGATAATILLLSSILSTAGGVEFTQTPDEQVFHQWLADTGVVTHFHVHHGHAGRTTIASTSLTKGDVAGVLPMRVGFIMPHTEGWYGEHSACRLQGAAARPVATCMEVNPP